MPRLVELLALRVSWVLSPLGRWPSPICPLAAAVANTGLFKPIGIENGPANTLDQLA